MGEEGNLDGIFLICVPPNYLLLVRRCCPFVLVLIYAQEILLNSICKITVAFLICISGLLILTRVLR